jgi:hypothetical protein
MKGALAERHTNKVNKLATGPLAAVVSLYETLFHRGRRSLVEW